MEYKMGLQEEYFNAMKYGSKKIEIRLFDEKRKQLAVGDTIQFLLEPDRKNKINSKIIRLTKYKTFSEAIENIPIYYLASQGSSKQKYLEDLNKYYSIEEQNKYGVIAIEVEIREKSCGLVVFKKEQGVLKVLLVHHNLGHWGLPKGHVEDNETEEEAAIRETLEETSVKAMIINGFRQTVTYRPKENVIKDVIFFIGESKIDEIVPQLNEISEASFIEIDKAIVLISYDNEKKLLKDAIDYYINH